VRVNIISILLIAFMSGCANRDLQFSYDRTLWQWEARTQISGSPFSNATVKVEIVGDEKPLRPDQLALVQRVIGWLPELMPQIIKQLAEYDKDLKDPKVLRDQLTEPSICLFEPDERPSRSWSFTIERPSQGNTFGYHLEFVDKEFKKIWAGN
jgi:hypothetical protein